MSERKNIHFFIEFQIVLSIFAHGNCFVFKNIQIFLQLYKTTFSLINNNVGKTLNNGSHDA